jgi:hypothetical protein
MKQHIFATEQQASITHPSGIMIKLGFKHNLTRFQENNVICSVARFLAMNYYQVLTSNCNQCQENILEYGCFLISWYRYEKMSWTRVQLLQKNEVPQDKLSSSEIQR